MSQQKEKISACVWNRLIANVEAAQATMPSTPWGVDSVLYAENKQRLDGALAALKEAFVRSALGQSGAAYVTHSYDWELNQTVRVAINRRVRARFFIPRKGQDWVEVISATEAEDRFQKAKKISREYHARYNNIRDDLVLSLAELIFKFGMGSDKIIPPKWGYLSGQEGGVFVFQLDDDGNGVGVAAKSALTAAAELAGYTANAAQRWIDGGGANSEDRVRRW